MPAIGALRCSRRERTERRRALGRYRAVGVREPVAAGCRISDADDALPGRDLGVPLGVRAADGADVPVGAGEPVPARRGSACGHRWRPEHLAVLVECLDVHHALVRVRGDGRFEAGADAGSDGREMRAVGSGEHHPFLDLGRAVPADRGAHGSRPGMFEYRVGRGGGIAVPGDRHRAVRLDAGREPQVENRRRRRVVLGHLPDASPTHEGVPARHLAECSLARRLGRVGTDVLVRDGRGHLGRVERHDKATGEGPCGRGRGTAVVEHRQCPVGAASHVVLECEPVAVGEAGRREVASVPERPDQVPVGAIDLPDRRRVPRRDEEVAVGVDRDRVEVHVVPRGPGAGRRGHDTLAQRYVIEAVPFEDHRAGCDVRPPARHLR